MCTGNGSDWPTPIEKPAAEPEKKTGGSKTYKLAPPEPKFVDEKVKIFTIGYGGMKSFEELKGILDDLKITALIDIRTSPRSRKWKVTDLTWDKKDLEAFFNGQPSHNDSIPLRRYIHMPELGGLGYEKNQFAEWKVKAQEKILEINKMADSGQRIALMCSEKHWKDCHRDYLAGAALRDLGKTVVNLGVK
jgi:uncharacterized protein (DUF488 family)